MRTGSFFAVMDLGIGHNLFRKAFAFDLFVNVHLPVFAQGPLALDSLDSQRPTVRLQMFAKNYKCSGNGEQR